MRVQIRSLDQANQNTQNASSLMKTAEGAVSSTVEILKSLKEKAINAATDTNTDQDRKTIQKEIDQFIDQIDDNALTTFNGKYLVDGSKAQQGKATVTAMTNQSLMTGTTGATELTALKNRNGESLEIESTDYVTASYVKNGETYTTKFKVGSNKLEDVFNALDPNTNVFANTTGTITDPGDSTSNNSTVDTAAMLALATASGVADAVIAGDSDALLTAAGGSDNALATITALQNSDVQAALGAAVDAETGTLVSNIESALGSITGNSSKYIAVSADGGTTATDVWDTGNKLEDADASDVTAAATTAAGVVANTDYGDLDGKLYVGASGTNAAGAKGAANPTGKEAEVTLTTDYMTARKNAKAGGNANLAQMKTGIQNANSGGGTQASTDIVAANSLIGTNTAGDNVYTADGTEGLTISSAKSGINEMVAGVTISITDSEGNVKKSANAALDDFTTSIYSKNASDRNELTFQVGASANQAITVGLDDMRAEALGLKSSKGDKVSVATQDNANAAIKVFDNAIQKAIDQQTTIGAVEARLEYTSSNLTTSSENVQAAESTIRDADMAKEMTNYTKNNVLLQAAQSMLAQANQSSSAVLSLLQ